MSEREFEAYLNLLARTLKLSEAQRTRVAGELRDHLEERMADLVDEGMERDEAILAALDEFGDANVLAKDLSVPQRRLRRRRLMQTSFATLATAAVIATGFFFLLPAQTRTGQPMVSATHAQNLSDASDEALGTDAGTPADDEPLERIITVNYDDQPLEGVLGHLQAVFGLNIFVYWDSLDDAGIQADTPVSMQLSQVRAKTALDLLTSSLGQGMVGYEVRDNVLIIGSRDHFETAELTVQMYRCGELLEDAEEIMGGRVSNDRLVGQLMDLIRESLGHTAWSQGESYAVFAGMVVVRQTPARHQILEGVLDQLSRVLEDEADTATALLEYRRSDRVRELATQAVDLQERQDKIRSLLQKASRDEAQSDEVRALKIELKMIETDRDQVEHELTELGGSAETGHRQSRSARNVSGAAGGRASDPFGGRYGEPFGGGEYGGGFGGGYGSYTPGTTDQPFGGE